MFKQLKNLIITFLVSGSVLAAAEYTVGFYSDFEPISYSESREENSPEFDKPRGYEADLLQAIELMSDLQFRYKGIKQWDGIWMAPTDSVDIAMGGITREKMRTLDEEGNQVILFTHPTVQFKQSLLILEVDKERINTHEDLTCADIVGAIAGTTGEYRFLVQSQIVDSLESGLIKKGVSVVLKNRGYITSDGNLSIYDPEVAERQYLIPNDCTLPLVRYFVAEDSMIPALLDKQITAIARGVIGNTLVSEKYPEELFVSAVYSLECPKGMLIEGEDCPLKENAGFTVSAQNQELLDKLNACIDYLTDDGKIGYDEWLKNKNIFRERAVAD